VEYFRGIGIVQALSTALELKDPKACQYAAGVLCNLSNSETLCKDIFDDGGVILIVNLAKVRVPEPLGIILNLPSHT
jgi:hypothetical protein